MATITQANRRLALGTPLGPDVLVIRSAEISEELGKMFRISVNAASEDAAIKSSDIVGQNVTIRLSLEDNTDRFWNGYVSHFTYHGILGNLPQYNATIVPWIWFLSRTADFRIFQQKTVPDMIKQIFSEAGYSDFTNALTGTYTPWEYCVQYRETDWNFLCRLMEQEGIYFFFEHHNGKHQLILADALSAHQPYPKYEKIKYRPDTGGGHEDYECIFDWTVDCHLQPGAYEMTDFDFKTPKKMLTGRAKIPSKHAAGDWDVFDYPGEYEETADANHYARVRLEELQAQGEIAHATSNARGAATGYLFSLSDYPRGDQNREYLITSATYTFSAGAFIGGDSTGSGPDYSCHFTAIDSKTQYRPPRVTPKPVIQGPQTAIVVGKAGEEIWTDEYGRVKIQFHWDRYNKADENSSCWVRVSQNWAGKKWGAMFMPRIGQEVIVDFIEGDPDQPIVTGRVYNGDAKPPYTLPDHQTMSTIKTLSSKGGGGFNELRFEDKKGSEQVFIHAEKNEDVRVKNNSMETIGADRSLTVGGDQFEKVTGDKHLHVVGDQNEAVNGTMSLQVGQNLQEKVGMNHGFEAGMEIHLKAGMSVVIEAGMSLTLKAGASFIQIDPSGIAISGMPMVLVNSGGAAGSGSGASPTSPQDPTPAAQADPGAKDEPPSPPPPVKPVKYSASATVLKQAAASATPFCEKCAAAAAAAGGH